MYVCMYDSMSNTQTSGRVNECILWRRADGCCIRKKLISFAVILIYLFIALCCLALRCLVVVRKDMGDLPFVAWPP
jgi:hypothetical protein